MTTGEIPTWRDFVAVFPMPNRVMAPMQYYGGKSKIARRIVPLLPPGEVYVEPFCGAASVFWHLPKPYPVEVLNDLNGDVINLFRTLQDRETFEQLAHRLTFTPYSRAEFVKALDTLRDAAAAPIDRAWATFVTMNQSMSANAKTPGRWGRAFTSSRGMADNTNNWRCRLRLLQHWHDRLTRVQLDNRDALEVVRYWDSPGTVFYLDPPYMHGTRVKGNCSIYAHEMTDAQHAELIDVLLNVVEGKAVLSGYDSELYCPLDEAGWRRVEIKTACYAAARNRGANLRGSGAALRHVPRTEVIWCSPRCVGGGIFDCSTGQRG